MTLLLISAPVTTIAFLQHHDHCHQPHPHCQLCNWGAQCCPVPHHAMWGPIMWVILERTLKTQNKLFLPCSWPHLLDLLCSSCLPLLAQLCACSDQLLSACCRFGFEALKADLHVSQHKANAQQDAALPHCTRKQALAAQCVSAALQHTQGPLPSVQVWALVLNLMCKFAVGLSYPCRHWRPPLGTELHLLAMAMPITTVITPLM